ncbi:MAG: dockerin type I repeat-containing protein [Ruminococcus sp.]|nr:dockerin type I repeat-containing protein [Ruminococcus sp.]
MKKIFSKTLSIILSTVILLSAVCAANTFTVSAETTDSMVYPGGEVKVTYSFAKDIWCTPCYFFEGKFDANVLEFKNDENHWSITPMVVPHDGYVSAVASSAYGVEVKPGDKIISYYYKVIGETNVNSIDFGFIQFQLYDDDGVELDASYVTYSVEVLSRGEEPTTEPATTEPKILYGDVNGNGLINIQDATEIQKFSVGINTPEVGSDLFELADVNDDGRISILDVTCVQKYLVGGYNDTGLLGK